MGVYSEREVVVDDVERQVRLGVLGVVRRGGGVGLHGELPAVQENCVALADVGQDLRDRLVFVTLRETGVRSSKLVLVKVSWYKTFGVFTTTR